MKRILFLIFMSTIASVQAQDTLRNFKFDSCFGQKINSESESIYCLVGTGFFKAPRASYTDSLISNWVSNNLDAHIIPVYSYGPISNNNSESKHIYVLAVNNSDTLNLILVRNGCVPGGTMNRPQTWQEMSKQQRKIIYNNKKPNERVLISKKEFNEFLNQVRKAEEEAKKNKVGIWSEEKDN